MDSSFYVIALISLFLIVSVLFYLYYSMKQKIILLSEMKCPSISSDVLSDKKTYIEKSSDADSRSEISDSDTHHKNNNESESFQRMNSALNPSYLPRPLNMIPLSYDAIQTRDRAVISDPLYPPLNRSSISPHDTYRMVGYLVGEESKTDVWQLYGRQVNNTRSEFYVRPTDRNVDMKIPLQDNDFTSPKYRLRNMDNLPDITSIDNPMFTSSIYRVVSNPNTDFSSLYF